MDAQFYVLGAISGNLADHLGATAADDLPIPQQPAVRTIRDKLTLLRMGAHATTSSRGWLRAAGGLCRW